MDLPGWVKCPELNKGHLDLALILAPIFQMYESDGSVMVYWHALDSGDASSGTFRTMWSRGGGWENSLGLGEVLFLRAAFVFSTGYVCPRNCCQRPLHLCG